MNEEKRRICLGGRADAAPAAGEEGGGDKLCRGLAARLRLGRRAVEINCVGASPRRTPTGAAET
jgi:hypothetical protein